MFSLAWLCPLFLVAACSAGNAAPTAAVQDQPATTPPTQTVTPPAVVPPVAGEPHQHDPPATQEPEPQTETAEDWLAKLESHADDTRSLTTRIRLTRVVGLLEEQTIRWAELHYAAAEANEKPSRFAVTFDRLKVDQQIEKIHQAYVFDGRWLLDVDHLDRTATRRELIAEDQPAELEFGEGPFLVPLNIKKDKLLARFNAELAEPDQDDPANSVHLILTPRPGIEIDAEQIDLWFDRDTLLPIKATQSQEDGDVTTVQLIQSTMQPNAEIDNEVFDTSLPIDGNYELQVVPLD